MSRRHSSRETILEAAEALVLETGALTLTLEAAARRAGVSKGGLLHHFPTKADLLKALLERLLDWFEQTHRTSVGRFPGDPSAELKAYVLTAIRTDERANRIFASLLATLAQEDPGLLGPIRDRYVRYLRNLLERTGDCDLAALVALAADGLSMLEVFHISPLSQTQRQRLVERLLQMAERAG